jgi:hypothetical protein
MTVQAGTERVATASGGLLGRDRDLAELFALVDGIEERGGALVVRGEALERLLVRWACGVVVPQQQAPRVLVPDAGHVLVEERSRADVVGVVVRVDEVGDLVAGAVRGRDLVDGAPDVVADRRRRVQQDDAGPTSS